MENAARRIEEPDIPGGGSACSSPWRPLCSVDHRLCAGGVGIAACLPDRLCLVARGGSGGGIAHLITRWGGAGGTHVMRGGAGGNTRFLGRLGYLTIDHASFFRTGGPFSYSPPNIDTFNT